MIFLTTTAPDVDEELLNRSIVLTVNEEREQTRAIHQKQREAQTLEGMWAQEEREAIVNLHRNAQRLLRPLRVVNEHVREQTFPDAMIRPGGPPKLRLAGGPGLAHYCHGSGLE